MKKPERKPPERGAIEGASTEANPDPDESLADERDAKIAHVRQREEKRLITLARKAGFFDRRVSTTEISTMFKELLKKQKTPKRSQLNRLEDQMNTAKRRQSAQERKDDARRKILLGAFIMAQIEHRPEEFTWLARELEKFLDTHPDATVAANNKLLMAEFLGEG